MPVSIRGPVKYPARTAAATPERSSPKHIVSDPQRPWSDAEITFLQSEWKRLTTYEIASTRASPIGLHP